MSKKNSIKKNICLLISELLVLFSFTSPVKANNYNNYNNIYTTSYDRVYIDEDISHLNNNGINVLDLRYSSNPGMKVINSCEVKNIKRIKEIVEVLIQYNNENDNGYNWSRSESSMIVEWIIHNILYELNILTDHTTDVDFNNNEFKLKK